MNAGTELALSCKYAWGRLSSASAVTPILAMLMALVYSAAWTHSPLLEVVEETSTAGMIVSAIAIKVIHWAAVRTSPSEGGGRGASKGAMRFSCVLVMADVNLGRQ